MKFYPRFASMALALCLGLPICASAQEWKEYSNQADEFRAKFPSAPKVAHESEANSYQVTLPGAMDSGFVVLVFSGKNRKQRYDLYKKMAAGEPNQPKPRVTEKMFGTVPGLEMEGLSPQGQPYVARIYAAPTHTYFVLGASLDLKQNREFLESFRIVPTQAAPAKKRR